MKAIMRTIEEHVNKDLLTQAIRFGGFGSETIEDDEFEFLLEQLKNLLAYVPTPEANVNPMLLKIYGEDAPESSKANVVSGQTYRHLIRSVYMGMIAMQALGGKFYETK